ncbi:response regulator [Sediminibacterium salmoneum]|uniref:response regulator n=1 Tax=Sediminibacterium salmoneum TaxID=426421 RepID=UPI00047DAFD4|nr:response regulator [Sediminibacterium salmoneum]
MTAGSLYTLLIADDDDINRVILKHMLKTLEMEVIGVSDGTDAMQYLNENPNKKVIILLDLNMPNMDGSEVISLINQDSQLRERVRIIVITANLLSIYMKEGIGSKVLDCFEKPVRKEVLIDAINLGISQLN